MRSDVIIGYRWQTNVDPCARMWPSRNLLLLHLFISLWFALTYKSSNFRNPVYTSSTLTVHNLGVTRGVKTGKFKVGVLKYNLDYFYLLSSLSFCTSEHYPIFSYLLSAPPPFFLYIFLRSNKCILLMPLYYIGSTQCCGSGSGSGSVGSGLFGSLGSGQKDPCNSNFLVI